MNCPRKSLTLYDNYSDMTSWTQRTELLIGESGMDALQQAAVLIVGLGGVGGMAAEMICRAGIGKMTIVDHDTINSTNLNRQILASVNTISRYKADVMAERLLQINPDLKLKTFNQWAEVSNIEELLETEKYDFVVDAIDTVTPKVYLIKSCMERGINIISSMGSGGRMDPSKVRITDISRTHTCPLAKAVRQRLSKMGITKGLSVVFSEELPNKKAVLTVEDEKYKKSTVGTISYMPAIFGCMMASHVIREIISKSQFQDNFNKTLE
jgi:tRNA A37 threonylcarbamoyladenosine dehydratase